MRPISSLAFAVICALAANTSLLGQERRTESGSVHHRNACRLAVQILETEHPRPHNEWALSVIGMCDESGPPVLAMFWSAPPADSQALEVLYVTSSRLRDARLATAVRQVALDQTQSAAVRITAMRVLTVYANPSVDPDMHELTPPEPGTVAARGHSSTFHRPQTEGIEPLPEDIRANVIGLFSRIEEEDPNPLVRYAAGQLQHIMEW